MLQAKTEYGKFVTLATMSRQEIATWKQETSFICPVCHERVIIKAGSKIVPHFAHRSNSHCPSQEGGEGSYHEKGKLLLFQWLKQQQLDVQLEAYLPDIKQRPDILIKLKNKTIALEYQCARIPPEVIIQRNQGYERAGIVPIWILGANRLEQRRQNQLKIDQFQRHFIHQFSSVFPRTLYYFSPETCQLILFQDMYFTTSQQATGRLRVHNLNKSVFTDLFKSSFCTPNNLYQMWLKEKHSLRLKPSKHLYGHDMAWHQWLYVNRTNKVFLPAIIYLPTATQFIMKTPPWDWQSRLYLEIIHPLTKGETFTIQRCTHLLRRYINSSTSFLLIKSLKNPLNDYLELLEQLQIIHRQSSDRFVKGESAPFYQTIDEALAGDTYIINQLIKQNTGMISN